MDGVSPQIPMLQLMANTNLSDGEKTLRALAELELCARDDRHPDRRVFEGVTGDRLRTALTRACTGAGVPTFSPHDLRHRRVSLLHLAGMPWARIGEQVGHDDLMTTARTYTHVVADEKELDYARLT
jgi:integrase